MHRQSNRCVPRFARERASQQTRLRLLPHVHDILFPMLPGRRGEASRYQHTMPGLASNVPCSTARLTRLAEPMFLQRCFAVQPPLARCSQQPGDGRAMAETSDDVRAEMTQVVVNTCLVALFRHIDGHCLRHASRKPGTGVAVAKKSARFLLRRAEEGAIIRPMQSKVVYTLW
jgi:hypothetical protein